MTVRTPRPSSAATTLSLASACARRASSLMSRRHVQPVPDLAGDLHHAGHRLLDQQRRVDRRPAGPGHRGLVAELGPHVLRGVRRDQAQDHGRRLHRLRTAGSAGPAPESTTLRVALTSSISRATTTLNLCASIPDADRGEQLVVEPRCDRDGAEHAAVVEHTNRAPAGVGRRRAERERAGADGRERMGAGDRRQLRHGRASGAPAAAQGRPPAAARRRPPRRAAASSPRPRPARRPRARRRRDGSRCGAARLS